MRFLAIARNDYGKTVVTLAREYYLNRGFASPPAPLSAGPRGYGIISKLPCGRLTTAYLTERGAGKGGEKDAWLLNMDEPINKGLFRC
jgi:hypothetical protein